jgi:hypothetical protein
MAPSSDGCGGCEHRHRCDTEKRGRILFRVLHPEIQATLRRLSGEGFIYIGREGIGLSYVFRKEMLRIGTIKAIEHHGCNFNQEEIRLLELTAIEGPRWLCYQRVIDALWNVQVHDQEVKPILDDIEAISQEIWGGTERSHV